MIFSSRFRPNRTGIAPYPGAVGFAQQSAPRSPGIFDGGGLIFRLYAAFARARTLLRFSRPQTPGNEEKCSLRLNEGARNTLRPHWVLVWPPHRRVETDADPLRRSRRRLQSPNGGTHGATGGGQ